MAEIQVFFDGSCGPWNPGGAMGWGAVIHLPGKPKMELKGRCPAGRENSNNLAEYLALKLALETLLEIGLENEAIRIRGDSMLVIRQMQRKWKIKNGRYSECARAVLAMTSRFPLLRFEWINREWNAEADGLSADGPRGNGGRPHRRKS